MQSLDRPQVGFVGRRRWLRCRQLHQPPEILCINMQTACQIIERAALSHGLNTFVESGAVEISPAHRAPRFATARTGLHPPAIHASISARRKRINAPSFIGAGIIPLSDKRRTWRVEQPPSLSIATLSIVMRSLAEPDEGMTGTSDETGVCMTGTPEGASGSRRHSP